MLNSRGCEQEKKKLKFKITTEICIQQGQVEIRELLDSINLFLAWLVCVLLACLISELKSAVFLAPEWYKLLGYKLLGHGEAKSLEEGKTIEIQSWTTLKVINIYQ